LSSKGSRYRVAAAVGKLADNRCTDGKAAVVGSCTLGTAVADSCSGADCRGSTRTSGCCSKYDHIRRPLSTCSNL